MPGKLFKLSILFSYLTLGLFYETDVTRHRHWFLFDHENCGSALEDRIIGGANASLGQYPWLARIGYVTKNRSNVGPVFKCAGSLINKMYVLTAAHCVTALPKHYMVAVIRLGENNAATEIDCENDACAAPVQDFQPEDITIHKHYGKPTYRNDIGLIRLDSPVHYNSWVQPICLPYGSQLLKEFTGTKAEVAGWGVYDIQFPRSSSSLLWVTLPIVNLEICIDVFRKYTAVSLSQLCVGGIVGKDSCGGDSGGPLMQADAAHGTPRYYVIGIVSFGAKRCGARPMPAVYTRLASFVPWILDNVLP